MDDNVSNKKYPNTKFYRILSDPKYRFLPRSKTRINIDKRFHGLFNDPRFHTNSFIDKRGKPEKIASVSDYKKYYNIGNDENEQAVNEIDNFNEQSSASSTESDSECDLDLVEKMINKVFVS